MREPGLFGRLAARRPVGLRMIDHYVPRRLPHAPATFDLVAGFSAWEMLGNGPDPTLTVHGGRPVGDCAFAGTVHLEMANAVETRESETWPTANDVVTAYLSYDGGQDIGASLALVLTKWRRSGLWGRKIGAFAPVPVADLDRLYACAYAFGALYLGISVPVNAQAQFAQEQSWHLTDTPADHQIVGGHCVVLAARSSGGGSVVTWGTTQTYDDAWLLQNLEEAWAVLTPEQLAAAGDGIGLNVAALTAILDGLEQ